jgi:4-amino-4-deoxy-L-arabinose transferase-like glycosyltransferase
MTRKNIFFIIAISLIVLASAGVVLYSTGIGPWTMVDTVDYFNQAANLSSGHGLVVSRTNDRLVPLVIHPPFYSIVLAPAAYFNLDLLQFARGLNVILFAILLVTVAWGTYRFTSSALLSISLVLWAITNRSVLRNYTAAMSESLFLTLGIVSIYLLYAAIRENKRVWLYTSAFLAGLALLTRYSGAAFPVAGFLMILVWLQSGWREKVKALASYSAIVVAPIVLWLTYNRIFFPGNAPGHLEKNLSNIWDIVTPFRLTFIDGLWNWLGFKTLFPWQDYHIQMLVIFFGFALLGLLTLFAIRIRPGFESVEKMEPGLVLGSAWVVFTIASIAVLLFSYVAVEVPKPWLDERLYSPIQMGAVLGVFFLIHTCSIKFIPKNYNILPGLLLAALLIFGNLPGTIAYAQNLHLNGEGYASTGWVNSEVVNALKIIPPGKVIVSNDPGAILFFTNRPASDLTNAIRQAGFNNVPEIVQNPDAAIVIFEYKIKSQLGEGYANILDQYLQRLTANSRLQFKGKDGEIYFTSP